MNASVLRADTLVVHGGFEPDQATGATAPSLVQSNAFAYPTAESLEDVFAGREPGYVYSRIANPTVAQFERRIATLENGLGAVACASGMAAISATVLALAGAGDEIVSGNSVFGGTFSLFQQTLRRYGITTRFVEPTDAEACRRAITDRTKLVFVEAIGNPKLDVPDIGALAAIAREKGVALAVDNTLPTPLLFQPGRHGADLVIHSTSKFINGHGNAIGGVVVDCGSFAWDNARYRHLSIFHKCARDLAFLTYLRNRICRDLGCCLQPFNAFLMSMGVESLGVRMERHCANAQQAAHFLSKHPRVRAVCYPGLAAHPNHPLADRQFSGRHGAILTMRLADKASCFRFINSLKRARNLVNLGDVRTLVVHPASTFCRDLDVAGRLAMGVTDDLVRFSIGIEHIADILQDMEESLKTVQQ